MATSTHLKSWMRSVICSNYCPVFASQRKVERSWLTGSPLATFGRFAHYWTLWPTFAHFWHYWRNKDANQEGKKRVAKLPKVARSASFGDKVVELHYKTRRSQRGQSNQKWPKVPKISAKQEKEVSSGSSLRWAESGKSGQRWVKKGPKNEEKRVAKSGLKSRSSLHSLPNFGCFSLRLAIFGQYFFGGGTAALLAIFAHWWLLFTHLCPLCFGH